VAQAVSPHRDRPIDKVTFELAINRIATRAVVLVASLAFIALLAFLASSSFIIGALTDERWSMPIDVLEAAAVYFPGSARLNARLAEYEFAKEERDLSLAESYARLAANLSPWDYNSRLLLADIQEAGGNRDAAEESLRRALALAPNNADVHWRLANLLLRLAKTEESVIEFRKAISSNNSLLGGTLDLIWRASGHKIHSIEAVTGEDPKSRLVLAQFLLKQSRVAEAASIFRSLDFQRRLESPEASAFLSMLVDSGQWATARDLWLGTVTAHEATPGRSSTLIWNGSFEQDTPQSFPQFDWNISASPYARLRISSDSCRTGNHSLRIDFAGRDTTRLDGEIKQLVVIRPGQRYRVECYAKRDRLVTPAGPCLAVLDARSSRLIAATSPVPPGSGDWEALSCEFIAPEDSHAVLVEIRRIPEFSYDDPTRGTIWFDDFALIELSGNK
jgi:thioredoxin-like negative regulator of GroEL